MARAKPSRGDRSPKAIAADVPWIGLAGAVLTACGPVPTSTANTEVVNACPQHPCSAYEEDGGVEPTCTQGVCTTPNAGTSAGGELVLLVSLAEDASYFASGSTIVVPWAHLFDSTVETTAGDGGAACIAPSCARLPEMIAVKESYEISPQVAMNVNFFLGNSGTTSLPVAATFRLLQDQWGTNVTSVGLPVAPIEAESFEDLGGGGSPGPQGGPSFAFQTYLQQGSYERTVVPDAPYGSVFAPEDHVVSVPVAVTSVDPLRPLGFDPTKETGPVPSLPTFNISRAAGLDGWTAYLRDQTTSRVLSNVVTLSGTMTPGVLLVTNHLPATNPPPDALMNTELVVAPPAGQPVPTGVFAPIGMPPAQELPAAETYPPLPVPVSLAGRVTNSSDGAPLDANLVFEALAIFDTKGQPNTSNFEFTTQASANASGGGTYQVVLPPGQYRIDVRPSDPDWAVTIANGGTPIDVDTQLAGSGFDIVVGPVTPFTSNVKVADTRVLPGADIDALPTACFSGSSQGDASSGATTAAALPSTWCMPRAVTTTSGSDGSFKMMLDPGSYLLRVRPAQGSGLPWVVLPMSVPAQNAPLTLPPVFVPAPVSAGVKLVDPLGNAVVHALVRGFSVPPDGGTAVEVGQAITDVNGGYGLYLPP